LQVKPDEQLEEHAISEERWYSREQLDEVWERVYVALQNQPATQALLRQKVEH
jgi:uracil-DNA glycosylase